MFLPRPANTHLPFADEILIEQTTMAVSVCDGMLSEAGLASSWSNGPQPRNRKTHFFLGQHAPGTAVTRTVGGQLLAATS